MDPVLREILEEELSEALSAHSGASGHLITLARQTEDTLNERDKLGARITVLRAALDSIEG